MLPSIFNISLHLVAKILTKPRILYLLQENSPVVEVMDMQPGIMTGSIHYWEEHTIPFLIHVV